MATEDRPTKVEIDGIEIPIGEEDDLVYTGDRAAARVLELMAEIEESEQPGIVLATATSRG